MSDAWAPTVPALITGVLGVLAVVITSLLARRAQREMTPAQIIEALRAEVAALRTRLDTAEARERIRDDYILELRDALDEAGEDVPPWPNGLTRNT